MLSVILFLFCVCSGSAFGAALKKRRFEECLPVTCLSITLFLYLAGLAGQLPGGAGAVFCLCGCLYAASLIHLIRCGDWRETFACFLSPGFFIFAFLCAFLCRVDAGLMMYGWDEFSHWGDCVKAMLQIDDFAANPTSQSWFQSYPPAMALFQYFFQKINIWTGVKEFSEWRLYYAYQINLFGMLFPAFRKLTARRPAEMILTAGFVLLSPFVIVRTLLNSVYVDPAIGIFAGCAFAVMLSDEDEAYKTVFLSLICPYLALLKDSGLLFSVTISLTWMLYLWAGGRKAKNAFRRMLAPGALPVLLTAAAKISWKWVIAVNHSFIPFADSVDLLHFTRLLLLHNDSTWEQQAVDGFVYSFFSVRMSLDNLGISINFFSVVLLLVTGIVLICFREREELGDAFSVRLPVYGGVILSVLAFCYGLGAAYISVFSQPEAAGSASFPRYLSTAVELGWVFMAVWIVSRLNMREQNRLRNLSVAFAVLLLFSPLAAIQNVLNFKTLQDRQIYRAQFDGMTAMVEQNCEENARIYYICQESDGQDAFVMKFNLRPRELKWLFHTYFADPDEAMPAGAVPMRAEDWRAYLQANCEYVLLQHVDDFFCEYYCELFTDPEDIADQTLFKVDKSTGMLDICARVS